MASWSCDIDHVEINIFILPFKTLYETSFGPMVFEKKKIFGSVELQVSLNEDTRMQTLASHTCISSCTHLDQETHQVLILKAE